MSRSSFPFHLQSHLGKFFSACGNANGVTLGWRSIKRVECKNCLKIIAANKETKYFKPLELQAWREYAKKAGAR
jgi:hypothetical protein